MKTNSTKLLLLSFILFAFNSIACSPCGALSNVTQTIVGTNLELAFTSNAGWDCCYTVQIEIICENSTFTGIPNYFSSEICLNGGTGASSTNTLVTPYPVTVIDISSFCPGNYSWRAAETSCGIFTPVQTFTVVGSPTPILINASLTNDTICALESTQFSASASGGCNSGPYSYSWSPTAGLSNANIANPTATPSVTTTYTLTVSETGFCTAPESVDLTITVNPTPTATISGTADLCQNAPPSDITFTGSGGTPPYTINYTLNGIAQAPIITNGSTTIQAPTSTLGTYVYALTSISEAGFQCSQNQTQSIVVTVNPLPVVDAGLDQMLCELNGITPSEVTLSGTGALTYTWDNGATDGIAFIPPVGTTTYTVIGTDANGCTDSDEVIIIINPAPTATISGTANICQNSPSGDVTFTGSGGTPPYTVNYTLNGVAQAPITFNSSITIQVPTTTLGTYVYALTSISESGFQCSQDQTQSIVVTVNPSPVVDAGLDQILCEPNGVTPSEVTLSGTGAITYAWNNGITDGVAFTPPAGTTTYTVVGTDANGCTDSDDVIVTALTVPIANGMASDYYGNAIMTIDFTNLSQFATSYVWDFGDGNIESTSSLSNISNTYFTPGFYTITLTASNGICSDTWTTQIEVIPPMIVTPPNVFTPNGDNVNDFYFVDVKYGSAFEAIILNRWGNEITTLTHLNQGWNGTSNGKVVEDGIYFIKYTATDFNDETIEGHTYFQILK